MRQVSVRAAAIMRSYSLKQTATGWRYGSDGKVIARYPGPHGEGVFYG